MTFIWPKAVSIPDSLQIGRKLAKYLPNVAISLQCPAIVRLSFVGLSVVCRDASAL